METGIIVLFVFMVVVGAVVGFLVGKKKTEQRYLHDTNYTQGTLNVDCSDPEFEPGLLLGLAVPVEKIMSRKYITLDINVMLQDSHK